MSYKKVALVASAALAASSVFVLVQPASGALVTRCTGVAPAVTVPGDLIVPSPRENSPDSGSCVLEGTTVLGDVRVQPGADLLAEGATIEGDIVVARDALADLVDTSVGGNVQNRNSFGTFLETSTVGAGVVQRGSADAEFLPFLYAFESDIEGNVDSRRGEVLFETATLTGNLLSRDGEYTDLVDSEIDGDLTVRTNALGSVVCESEIYGDALYESNSTTLQIGGTGAFGDCSGASFWGGNVTFNNNTAADSFDISNNIVRGDLTGEGNDPLPTGAGNRVRGEITLAFADPEAGELSLQSQSAESVENQRAAEAVVSSRIDQLQARIDERRGAAEKVAEETPDSQALVPGNS